MLGAKSAAKYTWKIKEMLKSPGLTHDMVNSQAIDVTTTWKILRKMIQSALQNNPFTLSVYHYAWKNGNGSPASRRIGASLSYVKARAGLQGLLHGDEDMVKYGFSTNEISALGETLHCHEKDSFALVIGEHENAHMPLM